MIHPDMATMLSFIMTDAEMPYPELQESLRYAVHRSFNSISVDGDTSTNDMVVVLANGASGIRPPANEFRDRLLARFALYQKELRLLTADQDVHLYEILSWPEPTPP